MLDESTYRVIMQATNQLLRDNVNKIGEEFCRGFMIDYDLANGRSSYDNAQRFYAYVVETARKINGRDNIRDNRQLFEIVWSYIEQIFNIWIRQQRGFSSGLGSGMGGSFSGPSMSSVGQGINFGQSMSSGPSSHLSGDYSNTQPMQPASPAIIIPPSVEPSTNIPSIGATTMINFTINPVDQIVDITTGKTEEAQNCWGGELPRDRTISVFRSDDIVYRDPSLRIRKSEAVCMTAYSSAFDVANKFFDTVPDSLMALPFIFRISYDHIETLNVPTSSVIEIRDKLLSFRSKNTQIIPFFMKVLEVVDTLPKMQWKVISKYLVEHVNRALHLAVRSSEDPTLYIKIGEIDDLTELLAAACSLTLMSCGGGRNEIKSIIEYSLLNAFGINSSVMFGDITQLELDIYTIKTSPVFPDYLRSVYPNKTAIPYSDSATRFTFLEKLHEHELSQRTYIRSRRSVVITNTIGQKVLPILGTNTTRISDTFAVILNEYRTNFNERYGKLITKSPVKPKTSAVELADFYKTEEDDDRDLYSNLSDFDPDGGEFLDQTIFAFQYRSDPKEYLIAIDVYSTLEDPKSSNNSVILSKRNIALVNLV